MPGRTPHQELAILDRRRRVAGLYLRGWTQWEIAREVHVSQALISTDLEAVRADWMAQAADAVGAVKARELAFLFEVEKAAWLAWERSRENAETVETTTSGRKKSTKKTSRGQAGDKGMLEVALECHKRRCRLLGIDEPKKVEFDGPAFKVYLGFNPDEV